MTVDAIPSFTYFTAIRNADLQILIEKLRAYDLPATWRVNIAQSSINLTSPKGGRIIKCDIYRSVFIDRIKGAAVKSEHHKCKSLEDAWTLTANTLDLFLKRGKHADDDINKTA